MPLPFLVAGAAVVAGAVGVSKGLDAKAKMKEAKAVDEEAHSIVKRAEEEEKEAREDANYEIKALGRSKLGVMNQSMVDFVKAFSQLKHVDFRDSVGLEELRDFTPDSPALRDLREACISVGDALGAGAGGITTGVVTAVGAYGAVGMLGTASTGAAIGGLSGAAATNATLAWLGGGSLASGGLGMAGGTAVLGGLVAGPALLVGGIYADSKADEALSKAKSNHHKAKEYEAQAENTCAYLAAVSERACQIRNLLDELGMDFCSSVIDMLGVMDESGTDWRYYSKQEQITIRKAAMLAKTVKTILDTSLLTEDGKLTYESEQLLIKHGCA